MRDDTPPERRTKRLLVSVTAAEYRVLADAAATSRLPIAVYLRTLGLGHEPKSFLDQDAVREVMRAHGDLGRIGGLLKLLLSDDGACVAPADEVRAVLHQIENAALDVRQRILEL